MLRNLFLSLFLLLGFVADAQLLNHQILSPAGDDVVVTPGDPIYYPTMQAGVYASGPKNEWWIAFLPSEYQTVGSTTEYKTVYWYPGDGGDGNATQVTAKNMTGSGTSWTMGYANGDKEVGWGTIVVKVNGVVVGRGHWDGTIKGNGITGTTNHTANNGTLSVTFDSTPSHTPTVDYVYSAMFEAGLPRYLNRGDTLDGKTIVLMIHRETDNTLFNTTYHFDNAITAMESLFRVDADRRIVAGLSRGAVFCKTLMIARHTSIAATIMAATDLSGSIPWADWYNRGMYWISGQNDAETPPPFSNYMNTIGGSHTSYRFYPKFTMYDAQTHAGNGGALWNTHSFNRETAPFDWVEWASLWNLDLDKQCEQHVERAENTLDIDHYREAVRAVGFMSAGSAKTSLQSRLSTLKTTIDAGRKRWYIDAGGTAPVTAGINQAANFTAGQNYTSLLDDNGNSTSVGFSITTQLITSGTNRVATANITGVPGWGFDRAETYDFAQVGANNGAVKWTGLNNGKTYKVTIYAIGGNGTVSNDINIEATVGGVTKSIFTQLSNTRKLEWTGVSPTSNEIAITSINNNGVTIGAGIQVFMLEEEN